jgi:hypothetical protein
MMDWGTMVEWRDRIKPVFCKISSESCIEMNHDTHYDAMNYEFIKVYGKQIYRVDFQPTEKYIINITKYVDTFLLFPRFFRLLHNAIPMFPYMAKTLHENMGEISGELDSEELKNKISAYLKNAL